MVLGEAYSATGTPAFPAIRYAANYDVQRRYLCQEKTAIPTGCGIARNRLRRYFAVENLRTKCGSRRPQKNQI